MTKSNSKVLNPYTGKKLPKNTTEGKTINDLILACKACPDKKILYYKTGKCTSKRDPRVTQDSNSREFLKFCEKYDNVNISSIDARFLDNFLDIKIPKRITGSDIRIKDLVDDDFRLGIKIKEITTKKNQVAITAIISSIVSSLIFFPKMRDFILGSLKSLFLNFNVSGIAITGFIGVLRFMTKDYFSEKAIDAMVERLTKQTPGDSSVFFTPKTKFFSIIDGSKIQLVTLKDMISKNIIVVSENGINSIDLEKLGVLSQAVRGDKAIKLVQDNNDGSVFIEVTNSITSTKFAPTQTSKLLIKIYPHQSEKEIKDRLNRAREKLYNEIKQESDKITKLISNHQSDFKNKNNMVKRKELTEFIKQINEDISKRSIDDPKINPYKKQLHAAEKDLKELPPVSNSSKQTIIDIDKYSEYSLVLAGYIKTLDQIKEDIKNSDKSNYLYNGAISNQNIESVQKYFNGLKKPF